MNPGASNTTNTSSPMSVVGMSALPPIENPLPDDDQWCPAAWMPGLLAEFAAPHHVLRVPQCPGDGPVLVQAVVQLADELGAGAFKGFPQGRHDGGGTADEQRPGQSDHVFAVGDRTGRRAAGAE